MTINKTVRGVRDSLPQGTVIGRPANSGAGPAVPLGPADLKAIFNSQGIGGGGSVPGVAVQSGGSAVGQATTLNFTGATVTYTAGKATIAIPSSTGLVPLAMATASISAGSAVLLNQTNVASITYTAVGRYRLTFTSAIGTNYGVAFAGRFPTEAGPVMPIINIDSTSSYGENTTTLDIGVETAAGVIADLSFLSVLVFSAGAAVSNYLLDTFGVTSTGAYSTRQLKTGAAKSMQVTRSSDSATMDIGFVGGQLDTATIATFVGSNTGYVSIWYDQSGSGHDLSQTTGTLSNCPRIVDAGTACVNAAGTPSVKFPSGLSTQLSNSSASLLATAFSIGFALEPIVVSSFADWAYTYKTGSFGVSLGPGMDNSGKLNNLNPGAGNVVYTSSTAITANQRGAYAFTSAAGVTVGTTGPLVMTAYQSNTSLGSTSLTAAANTIAGFGIGNAADTFQGYMTEVIFFGSVLDSAHLTTLYTSQAAL